MKPVLTILALWVVAILSTVFVLRGTGLITVLAPVYAICTIGSVLIVRTAVGRRGSSGG